MDTSELTLRKWCLQKQANISIEPQQYSKWKDKPKQIRKKKKRSKFATKIKKKLKQIKKSI